MFTDPSALKKPPVAAFHAMPEVPPSMPDSVAGVVPLSGLEELPGKLSAYMVVVAPAWGASQRAPKTLRPRKAVWNDFFIRLIWLCFVLWMSCGCIQRRHETGKATSLRAI